MKTYTVKWTVPKAIVVSVNDITGIDELMDYISQLIKIGVEKESINITTKD